MNNTKTKILRIILTVSAVLLFAAGIYGGEPNEVYKKAVNICMECIGIG